MITPNELKTGMLISFDNKLFEVVEYQHVKPGKGGAFVRTKLRDIKEGSVIDKTFRGYDTIEEIHVEEQKCQFLYKEGEKFLFMDKLTYEQISFSEKQLGGYSKFLKEGMEVSALFYSEKTSRSGELTPLTVELPNYVELKVVEAPPGIKGDTVSAPTKEATLENGYNIQVPLFIKPGDVIKINTKTGEYVERA